MDKLRQHLSQLKGKKARCLIEGFACPYNAGYLHEFLKKFKIEPTIFVIDINERGYKNAKLKKVDRFIKKFVKTDAINTGFKNNIFDFVIQDFLLNCSPFHLHDKIIKEVFRVLKPNGVFLTSYSYLNSFPKVPLFKQEIIEKNYQIELEKLLSFRENMKTKFKQKFIQCPEGFIFITSTGDFEFYRKRKSFKNIFKKYFEALDKKIEIAKDRNGLLCERWREVYKKSKLK
jgi:ubiquinone/menaquinone biosynthesis C-methylase UbiE